VYFGSRHNAQVYIPTPAEKFTVTSVGTNIGITRPVPPELEAELARRPDLQFADRGALIGWDPVARKPRWRTVNPGNGIDGGTLATAGDLVFAGGGNNEFIAYRADDGARLWSFDAKTGVAAGPVSYELDGVQYIAVAAGRGLQPYYQANYSRLLVFKRGGNAALPPAVTYVPPPLTPPPSTASAAVLAHGAELYGQNCVQCHGNNVSNFPDLKVSPAIQTQALFDAIVLGGAREQNGMASFAAALSRDDAASVREYVVSLARAAKFEEDAKRTAAAGAEPHAQ
jgi:mono/diheme cytochrome c family protein